MACIRRLGLRLLAGWPKRGRSQPAGRVRHVTGVDPDAPPARWVGLIGQYGPDDDVWLVLEDESRLHVRHGEMAYPLEETSADEFPRSSSGAEARERLLFTRGGDGRAAGFQLGEARFTRRETGTVGGETFRIELYGMSRSSGSRRSRRRHRWRKGLSGSPS